ncbi:MAG: FliA/WhiG family RNA polymerase sigma factor [Desulfobacteraceae bacterium]|nr:FliA/WhiG family RNA polymerase sigma factor [Desulfobacteraceae bacterium]
MVQKESVHRERYENWRETTIVEHAYLVKRMAARFALKVPKSVLFGELVSAGSLGLIDAVDKFDPNKHVSFKTYAQYRIKGAILDELRSMDTYSRSMRKKIQDIAKAVKKVEVKKGNTATDIEIAQELGVDLEFYYGMLTDIHGASVLNLDDFIRVKKNNFISSQRFQGGVKSKDDPSDKYDKEEIKAVFAKAIKKLSKKQQMVISLYYYDELTLKEIGEVLSLTESRICQIHAGILIKMKSLLQDYFD